MIIINKVPLADSSPVSYLKIKIDFELDLKIEIITKSSAWTGKWSVKQMKEFCQISKLEFNDYKTELKNVLTAYLGVKNYYYSIAKNIFIVKKTVSNSKMKMRFAVINLSEAVYEEAAEIFVELAIDSNKEVLNDLEKTRHQNNELLSEKYLIIEKLNKYKCLKQDIEESLYGKFLVLLNSKKDKITQLEELLETYRNDTNSQGSEKICKTKKPIRLLDTDTESEPSDTDFNKLDSQNSESFVNLPKRKKPTPIHTSSPVQLARSSSTTEARAITNKKIIQEQEMPKEMELNTQDLFDEF